MESQLLECLEALSSAGDDERARLRKVSRTVGYEELPKSWRALVRIAAAKTSPHVAAAPRSQAIAAAGPGGLARASCTPLAVSR